MINVHILDFLTLLTAATGIIILINRWNKVKISHFNALLFIYIVVYCLYTSLLFLKLLDIDYDQEFLEDLAGAFLPMFWIIIFYVLVENEKTKKLIESDKNWQITFQSIGDGIITTDLNAKILKMNPVAEYLTGWRASEAVGLPLEEVFNTINFKTGKPSHNPAMTVISSGKRSGLPNHTTLISRIGKKFQISDSAAPIIDSNDKITGVVLVFRDITESYTAQEKIKENESRMRMIIESTQLGTWEWNNTREDLKVFNDWTSMLGYLPGEVRQTPKKWRENIHPSDKFKVIKALTTHVIQKTDYFEAEHRLRTKSGEWKWILLIGKVVDWDVNGKPARALGVYRDIDNRKQSEEKIYFHANLLNDVETGIYVLDTNESFTYWNPFAAKLYGWSEEEVLGKSADEIFRWNEYDSSGKEIINNLKKGESFVGEYKSKKKNGTFFTALIKNTPLFDKSGNLTGTIGIVSDISIRKKMETELRLKNLELIKSKDKAEESDRLKTAFLANLSHEVRTPMNGILGFAELLKEHSLPEDLQRKYIEVIEQSGLRMIRIIDDLVDISKIEAGTVQYSPEKIAINNLLDGLFNFFAPSFSKKSIKFELIKSLPDNDCYIITDPLKLEQIMTNLISNALKFTDTGSVEFGYEVEDKLLKFYVKDTGIGIPDEFHKIVFERFRQAEPVKTKTVEGTGLGLAICKAYVELIGGTIGVDSSHNKGSLFWFKIPYNKA